MRFLFRLNLSLDTGAGKKFGILIFATKRSRVKVYLFKQAKWIKASFFKKKCACPFQETHARALYRIILYINIPTRDVTRKNCLPLKYVPH